MNEIKSVLALDVAMKGTLETQVGRIADELRVKIERLGESDRSQEELQSLSDQLESLSNRKFDLYPHSETLPGLVVSSPIDGTPNNDLLFGTPFADEINGFGGNDTILALSGNDKIYGGSGDDLVIAGSGDDEVYGGNGADQIFGGNGNDKLRSNAGIDVIFGEAGDDDINGGSGRDRLFGDGGNDKIAGGNGADIINGGDGDDRLHGQNGNDRIFAGAGADFVSGGNGNDDLNGNDGNDELRGGAGRDRIFGGAGEDVAYGDGGNDTFIGSLGSDSFNGGANTDTADYSGIGGQITYRAEVEAIPNNPQFPFGGGFTRQITYQVSKPDNSIDTLDSIERIIGAPGEVNTIDFSDTDTFTNAPVINGVELVGAPAIQVNLAQNELTMDGQITQVFNFKNVIGTLGNDTLVGDDQDNVLTHGPKGSQVRPTSLADQDTLIGGGGNDTLVSNGGDTMTGGSGADKFTLTTIAYVRTFRGGGATVPTGPSTITDFQSGQGDQLVVSRAGGIGSLGGISFQSIPPLSTGGLSSDNFTVVSGSTPPSSTTAFTYNSTSGDLFFRGISFSGSSAGISTYKVATFAGAPTLQASDIIVA